MEIGDEVKINNENSLFDNQIGVIRSQKDEGFFVEIEKIKIKSPYSFPLFFHKNELKIISREIKIDDKVKIINRNSHFYKNIGIIFAHEFDYGFFIKLEGWNYPLYFNKRDIELVKEKTIREIWDETGPGNKSSDESYLELVEYINKNFNKIFPNNNNVFVFWDALNCWDKTIKEARQIVDTMIHHEECHSIIKRNKLNRA